MHKIFVPLYNFFSRRRTLLYVILGLTTAIFLFFGIRIYLEEDVMKLLPRSSMENDLAFSDIKLKDKIILQLTSRDGQAATPEELAGYMDELVYLLEEEDAEAQYIDNILYNLDAAIALNALDFGLEHLPTFIDTAWYPQIEALLQRKALERQMVLNRRIFEEDETGQISSLIALDPINMHETLLSLFLSSANLGSGAGGMNIIEGHFFSPDSTVCEAFLSPKFVYTESGKGTELYRMIERARLKLEADHPDLKVLAHGDTLGSVSNASTIKRDIVLTVGLSFIVIIVILLLCFHDIRYILQIISPIAYGTAFSLCILYWIKGSMSLLALGMGAIVLGVAISYILHVLIHYYYTEDVPQMLREQSTPVILGCMTTVGAFLGLMFTESDLLRDFGLFASLALTGSTLFSLIFLPHFLSPGQIKVRRYKGFHAIDRVNGLPWDRNPWILGALGVVMIVGLVMSPRVRFDSDLRNLDYDNEPLVESQQLYEKNHQDGCFSLYFAAWDEDLDNALEYNEALLARIDSLTGSGLIKGASTLAAVLLQPTSRQQERIEAWEAFWTTERKARAKAEVAAAARKAGLDAKLFRQFDALIDAEYTTGSLYDSGLLPEELAGNFIELEESGRYLVFTPVSFLVEDTNAVEDALTALPHVLVLEPFYYCSDLVEIIHDDFSKTLWISSIFVFLVLLLAFRRIGISVIAFLPMFLSWYLMQGLMAVFGLEFNLINIVISTFVYGIGVDYSIFVMEGLLARARSGRVELLEWHKTAIFFSAMVLLIVVLSLVFANHPSIRSIGLITVIGMTSTILLTYSLEPFIFNLMLRVPAFRRAVGAQNPDKS